MKNKIIIASTISCLILGAIYIKNKIFLNKYKKEILLQKEEEKNKYN